MNEFERNKAILLFCLNKLTLDDLYVSIAPFFQASEAVVGLV